MIIMLMRIVDVGAVLVRVVVLLVEVVLVANGRDDVVVVICVLMFCCVVRAVSVALDILLSLLCLVS